MGKWLWYPGEFEFLLYNKLMMRRLNRDKTVIPGWRIDGVYPYVYFEKRCILESSATAKISSCGKMSVFLDGEFNLIEHFDGELEIPAGSHVITLQVYNPDGLPCIYVESCSRPELAEGWMTRCGTYFSRPAESRKFAAGVTPNSYALPVRHVDYVGTEKVDGDVLYDFGKEIMAFAVFEGGCGEAKLFYGETKEEALDKAGCETCETVVLGGRVTVPCARAFRYVRVEGGKGGVFYADEEYRPMVQRGYFRCNDDIVNSIYGISLRTLELNSREFFIDGIKRDRWVWAGDVYACLNFDYYSYFDAELVEDSLTVMLGKYKPEMHVNFIPEYSMYLICAVRDHATYTGRTEYVEKVYSKVVDLLEFCLADCNEEGWFVKSNPAVWIFIDWADLPEEEKEGVLCFEQIVLAGAMRAVAEMGERIFDPRAAKYRAMYDAFTDKILRTFWKDGIGFIYGFDKNRAPMYRNTRYSEIFALRFGLLQNGKMRATAAEKLLKKKAMAITTPFMKFFELDAVAELGYVREAFAELRDYWGRMVAAGAECAWEEFTPEDTQTASVGTKMAHKYGASKCHAWGAGPVYLLPRYIAGVRKTDTGCEISPSLKVLSEFDAEVPLSENLFAKVAWKGGVLTVDADCDILLKLPCGMKVEGLAGNGEYRLSAGRYFLTIIS